LEKEKVALKWKGVMQKDLIKYKIYRGEDDQEPIVIAEVEPKEENKFFDENAEVGKKYVYYVTSVNKYNQESGKSEKVIIRR
jgi:fibronectin type 3 domain-containing protein